MSTTQRVVRKQLAGAEDILQGVGTVTQTRGSGSYPIHKLDIPIPTYDIAEMQASSAEFMRLYGTDTAYTDYRRNPEGTIGIPSNLGGVWEPMRFSEYLVCGNFATGAYVFSSDCIVALGQQSYNWQGALPKVVAAGATPETTGGIGAGAWVDRTGDTLRSDLASATGADLIPTVADVYFAADLDTSGVIDESATISALWAKYKTIKLPRGRIKANINVPSGCALIGSGQQGFDRASLAWDGCGTLLIGTLGFSGSKFCTFGNLSIDTFDLGTNAIVGATSGTEYIYGKQVTTRANNHGQLWEQNGIYADGRDGGDIVVEDCIHYGGPNGFVTKMKNVNFIRCFAYDVTVQAFVAVSDNVNGQGVFSRALNCNFIDCGGDGNNEGLRVYSRNYHDGVDAVAGALGIRWIRSDVSGVSGRIVRTGDFISTATSGGFTRIINETVELQDGGFVGAPYSAIRFENVNRPIISGSPVFGGNSTNVEFGDDTLNPIFSDKIQFADAPDGSENRILSIATNVQTISLLNKPEVVVFNNTSTVTVNAVTGMSGVYFYKTRFVIADEFTTCTFTGRSHRGSGTTFEAYYNGASWVDCGENLLGTDEVNLGGSAASVPLDLGRNTASFLWSANGVNITSVVISNPTAIRVGQEFTLRINAGSTTITIAGWDAAIKWPDGSSALSSLAGFRKAIIKMRCVQSGAFVVTGTTIYV